MLRGYGNNYSVYQTHRSEAVRTRSSRRSHWNQVDAPDGHCSTIGNRFLTVGLWQWNISALGTVCLLIVVKVTNEGERRTSKNCRNDGDGPMVALLPFAKWKDPRWRRSELQWFNFGESDVHFNLLCTDSICSTPSNLQLMFSLAFPKPCLGFPSEPQDEDRRARFRRTKWAHHHVC